MRLERAQTLDSSLARHGLSENSQLRPVAHFDFLLIKQSQASAELLQDIRDFLDTQDSSHPFQWPQWSGRQAHFAVLRKNGRIEWFANCGILYPAGRLLQPVRALIVNRGPVCDDPEILGVGLLKLLEQARKMGFAYIDIAPEWMGQVSQSAATMLARNGWQALTSVRHSLRLSLSATLDDLMASFRKTTRYEIRRSMNEAIEVKVADEESECQEFLRLYQEMANHKKFPAEESDFLLSVCRWLKTDEGRGGLFLAYQSGTLRGGALVVRSGKRCWYVLGASLKDGKVGVGHLLQWRAIEWAKEKGCLEYDFGGFREGVSSGPALFKRGFCDRVVPFIAPHRYVTNSGRYRIFESVSNVRRILRKSS